MILLFKYSHNSTRQMLLIILMIFYGVHAKKWYRKRWLLVSEANFHPIEFAYRYRDPQLQVGEKVFTFNNNDNNNNKICIWHWFLVCIGWDRYTVARYRPSRRRLPVSATSTDLNLYRPKISNICILSYDYPQFLLIIKIFKLQCVSMLCKTWCSVRYRKLSVQVSWSITPVGVR